MGDDSVDDAGDLVSGRKADERLAGEQDVVRANLDDDPRTKERSRNGTISSGPSSSLKWVARSSGEWTTIAAGKTLQTPSQATELKRSASSRAQNVQGRPLGNDPAGVQQEQPRAEGNGLGRTVSDIEHRNSLGTLHHA